MGPIGNFLSKNAGNIGAFAGKHLKKYTGLDETFGRNLGDALGPLGRFIKFEKGGRVKRTGKAIVHKGEYVLPVGVKPTKSQVKAVAKRRKPKHMMRKYK